MKKTSKKESKSPVADVLDAALAEGWKMQKLLVREHSSGGLFSYYVPATYDNRTVYNRDDMFKLVKEGFALDEDAGVLVLNMLFRL